MAHNIPGVANLHDSVWTIKHPDGMEVSFTDYNHEITGHTDNAADLPILGEFIHYGGNAYYVVREAKRLGWTVIGR